jgi:hypothetical protein
MLELPLDPPRDQTIRIEVSCMSMCEHCAAAKRVASRQHHREFVALQDCFLERRLGANALAHLGLQRLVGPRQLFVGLLQAELISQLARLLGLQRGVRLLGRRNRPAGGYALQRAPLAVGPMSTATLLRRISGTTGMYT